MQCEDIISRMKSLDERNVTIEKKIVLPRSRQHQSPTALQNVSNIIAVSSCKGGVGKSTVAINLAFMLSKMGGRVGILDADIYGPSLPSLISPEDTAIRKSKIHSHFVTPIDYHGVKCMSFGFVNQKVAPGAGGKNKSTTKMRKE